MINDKGDGWLLWTPPRPPPNRRIAGNANAGGKVKARCMTPQVDCIY